jgi:hypothetical protein
MIDTGLYLPIRCYIGKDLKELSINDPYCSKWDNPKEYFTYRNGFIPPFQFVSAKAPEHLKLVDVCSGEKYTISDVSYTIETIQVNKVNQVYSTWNGGDTITEYPNGKYYLEIGTLFYTDIFIVSEDETIEIKYRDTGVRGGIHWRTGFYAIAGINSTLERPAYPIDEEQREDQQGDTHRVFQRWTKRYSISFKAIESMADAVSLLPTMDEVYVNDTRVYDVLVDISWEDEEAGTCLCDVTISFVTRKLVKTF